MEVLLPMRYRRGQTYIAAQGSHQHQHRETGHSLAVPRIVDQGPGIVPPRVSLRHHSTHPSHPVGCTSGGAMAGALRAETDCRSGRPLGHGRRTVPTAVVRLRAPLRASEGQLTRAIAHQALHHIACAIPPASALAAARAVLAVLSALVQLERLASPQCPSAALACGKHLSPQERASLMPPVLGWSAWVAIRYYHRSQNVPKPPV